MTAIPPDARKVVLAAVVPCAENPPHHMLCRCFGTNECTVVTDIEVEQVCIAEEGMYEELVWREVER